MGSALLLAAIGTLGAGEQARLSYSVAPGLEGCPDEAWVRSAVAARLGRDPFSPGAALEVTARLEAATPGLTADVEVRRADGTRGRRRLDSPPGDCLELASAVELAIALAIEPTWLLHSSAPPTEAPPPAPVPPRAGLRAAILGAAGGVPGFTGGLLVGGTLRRGLLEVGLDARALWPTGINFGAGRATAFSALFSFSTCLRPGALSGCAVLSLGPYQVQGVGPQAPRTTTLMAQAGVRLGGAFRLSERLALGPWGEAAVVLTRTALVSDGVPLWVTWPLALSFGLAVEVLFSS